MHPRILSLILPALIALSNGLPSINTTTSLVSHREPKFFPFYTLGRFAQDVCIGSNSLIGTCVLTGQCSDLGGTSTGTSACSAANTRQASCCIVTQTCSSTTQFNNTYFVNANYPQTFPGGSVCTIQVTRQGTDVCQLRIDFLDFSLAQPTGDGLCTNDYFTVQGGSSFVPRICGENSGQHIYVAFAGNNPITIRVATSGSFTFNRRWHFHLQQIGCDSPSMAPSGCLQYWQDSSGWVSSFNYASGASGVTNSIGVQGSRQIANLAYGACIKAAAGTCSITYSRGADIFGFSVTGDVGAIDPAILGTAAVQDQACTTDFVTIPNAHQNGAVVPGGDRFCGLGIDDTTSNALPYVIYTVTDGNETPDIASRSLSPIVTFLIVASLTAKSKTVKILTEIGLIASLMTMVRSQSIVDYLNDYEYFDDDYYYEDYFEEPDHRPPNGHRPQHHNHHDPEPISIRVCGGNNDVVHGNNSMLANPNYPQPFGGGRICYYRIHRRNFERGHRHICQLRIDFLAFSLAQPTGDGVCATDYFTVLGGSTTVPRICGENTGQHVYVGTAGILPITVVVATTTSTAFNRRWQLRVTQIPCHSRFKAPANCLQYHIGSTGFIRSFNYASESNGNRNSLGVTGSRQIANMQYNICIRTQPGLCSITYRKPTSDRFAFSLTDDVNSVDAAIIGSPTLQSQTCTTDYITIPAPSQINFNGIVTALTRNRFCGLGIGVITSRSQPFIVTVVTDANETPDIANRGFYLNYAQGVCIG